MLGPMGSGWRMIGALIAPFFIRNSAAVDENPRILFFLHFVLVSIIFLCAFILFDLGTISAFRSMLTGTGRSRPNSQLDSIKVLRESQKRLSYQRFCRTKLLPLLGGHRRATRVTNLLDANFSGLRCPLVWRSGGPHLGIGWLSRFRVCAFRS